MNRIRELIRRGFDVNIKNDDGWTPVIAAASAGKQLLKLKKVEKINFNSNFVFCNLGQNGIVEVLLRNGANINEKSKFGYSALHVSVQNGKFIKIQVLILFFLTMRSEISLRQRKLITEKNQGKKVV